MSSTLKALNFASKRLMLQADDWARAIGRPSIFGEIKVGLGWIEESELPWIQDLGDEWYERSRNRQGIRYSQVVLGQIHSVLSRKCWTSTSMDAEACSRVYEGSTGCEENSKFDARCTNSEDFADAISKYLGTNVDQNQ